MEAEMDSPLTADAQLMRPPQWSFEGVCHFWPAPTAQQLFASAFMDVRRIGMSDFYRTQHARDCILLYERRSDRTYVHALWLTAVLCISLVDALQDESACRLSNRFAAGASSCLLQERRAWYRFVDHSTVRACSADCTTRGADVDRHNQRVSCALHLPPTILRFAVTMRAGCSASSSTLRAMCTAIVSA